MITADRTYDPASVDAVVPDAQAYAEAAQDAQLYSVHYESVQVQADNVFIEQVENLNITDPVTDPGPPPLPLSHIVPARRRECDSTVNKALRAELTLPPNRHYSKDPEHSNQLLSAIYAYKDDRVKNILLKRADPNKTGSQYAYSAVSIPLRVALSLHKQTSSSSKKQRCASIMKYLIFAGADLETRMPQNETPLTALAAMSGPHELLAIMCEMMAEQGHDDFVNWANADGVTALYAILRLGKSSAVRRGAASLLDCGADANIVPPARDSPTPLELALSSKDYRTLEALLEHGADPNVFTAEGRTLLYTCVSKKDLKTAELLLKHGANPSTASPGASNRLPLHVAVTANNLELAKLLISHGSELDIQDDSDAAPLIYAVEQDNHAIIQALLDAPADPNVTVRNEKTGWYEWSVLSYAMWQRKPPAIARALVEAGADVDFRNGNYEETPLHIAACAGDHELVRLLLDEDADVEARSSNNYSALGIAIENGQAEVAKVLIEVGGADVNVRDGYNSRTPLCMIEESQPGTEFAAVRKLILERGGRSERVYYSSQSDNDCVIL